MNFPDQINAEELLSVLFYSPNATAVYQDEDVKILSANEAMLKFWGKSREIIGKDFCSALPELDGQPFFEILRNVWLSGETFMAKDYPAVLLTNGFPEEFYFDFEYRAILGPDGKTKYILHTASEVTERKEALKMVEEKSRSEQKLIDDLSALNEEYLATNEDLVSKHEELFTANHELLSIKKELLTANHTLAENEKRFKNLVEQSPVAMASLQGENFEVDIVNDQALRIWNKDRSVVGMPLSEALPELKNQPFIGILKEVYATRKPYFGKELKIMLERSSELTECYLNFVYQPIFDENNETTYILVVATDVTEQVQARESVIEMKNRLEIALDASRLGSTEIDLSTGSMESTNQFKYNYGYRTEDEFTYLDLYQSILPEHRRRIKDLVKDSIKNNEVYKAEYPVKWRDGSIHWIQAHGRPRFNKEGVADRMVGMNADVTDKKMAEQRKDDFLSVASHELKTPLTAVRASIQLLNRIKEKPYSQTHIRLIEQSDKGIEKMCVLIDDLLNMSRLGQDQLMLEYHRFNLYEMLDRSCHHIRLEGKHQVAVSGDKSLEIYADEHRIEQVVINLLNNAVKYAKGSNEIHLFTEAEPDCIRVSVRDFGQGIPEAVIPHLFDRYFRAEHIGRSYSGLGLGLYICSEIIKKHSGKIGVISKMGEGSTFWFTLPRKKAVKAR